MAENRPLSLVTCLAWIGAAARKLAGLGLAGGLLRSLAGLRGVALAGVAIMFFAWSCEHQARRHDAVQAQQVKKQAAEAISQLQQQAAGALRDAQQSAQAVRELESQRQKLARDAEGLRQSLESLRQQELARTNEVATLPTSEVVNRVASRLQEQVSGAGCQVAGEKQDSGFRIQDSGQPEKRGSGVGGQVSGQPAPDTQPPPPSASSASRPALVLSDQGVRKVESALSELDSCRQQAQVMGQQVSNCEQQAKLDSTMLDQQSGAISKLQAALADKDKILAQSEAAHRAELKAARGTWRSHFMRAVEYFAGGFVAGVLVR
jgi:hypothetical protein